MQMRENWKDGRGLVESQLVSLSSSSSSSSLKFCKGKTTV